MKHVFRPMNDTTILNWIKTFPSHCVVEEWDTLGNNKTWGASPSLLKNHNQNSNTIGHRGLNSGHLRIRCTRSKDSFRDQQFTSSHGPHIPEVDIIKWGPKPEFFLYVPTHSPMIFSTSNVAHLLPSC